MKPLLIILAAALVLGVGLTRARAEIEVSVDFFHDSLEEYGDWREVGDYGYCWQPRNVDRDWRPYSDGRWIHTDAGWTWDSDEPYSWAVYHYGRWARVARVGWVWVPDTEWGPAWVSWRHSDRHVGWAPLPPEARFNRNVGFSARVDVDFDIGPTNYNFVEVRNFGAPRLRTVIVEPRQNITFIHQTTNITRVTYVNNVVYNEGPQYDVIARESAQPIRRLRLDRREERNADPRTLRAEQLRSKVEGDSLRVVALPFVAKPARAPRKVAAKVEKVEVDRGWKDAGPPAEVEKLRAKIKTEPVPPPAAKIAAPARIDKPAEAPAPSTIAPPAPDDKPAKGKVRADDAPKSDLPSLDKAAPQPKADKPVDAPAPTPVAPAASEDKPAKGKQPSIDPPDSRLPRVRPVQPTKAPLEAKPETLEEPKARPAPRATDDETPAGPVKNGRKKGTETPRPRTEIAPKEPAEKAEPKSENAEPKRKLPPAEAETPRRKIRPEADEARTKPEPPARSVERKAPTPPEPRPQATRPEPRQKAVPAVPEPQAPKAVKGKGKAKDDEKEKDKDAAKQ
jgi:hypothetical protein